jgi:acyl-coenzyme A synthetase/AMP-(fatty) acid ligase
VKKSDLLWLPTRERSRIFAVARTPARFNARGGAFALGRSERMLNRHGVRIGTAEIYRSFAAL